MDASDLHACREQLLADMKTHEFVECEVATRADRNLPEP